MNEKTKSTLILGLGNPVLGNDRLGLLLVEDLQKNSRLSCKVSFQCSSQSGLYLLDLLIGFYCTIFIDTIVCPNEPPGKVKCWKLEETASTAYGSSPHYIGVNSMIAIGKSLNLAMPKKLWLIGVTIKDGIQITEKLSPGISKKYSQILNKVERQVNRILANVHHTQTNKAMMSNS